MAKVLWMDDYAGKGTKDRVGFDGLVYFIEKNGHTVDIASTRDRIEEFVASEEGYDLLILDIIMEPLSGSSQSEHQYGGMDVLERLAKGTHEMPIIVLSVMPALLIKEEASRRKLDLGEIGVKEIKRKGSVTPTELAQLVEEYVAAGSKGGPL